jgi:putative peptidoglycan lipid II flippase
MRSLGASIGLALPAVGALLLLGRPTIRILFERGEFTGAAGDLTFNVLVAYAVALPAYVATEVITRGLIALRDTRTPLFTNSGQLIARILLISILLPGLDVVAIPAAFAISSTLETLMLASILFLKLRGKLQEQQAVPNFVVER